MALGSTQTLTKMSNGCKCGRCVRLKILPPPCAVVMTSGNLKFLEFCGPLQTCNGTALPLLYMFRTGLLSIIRSLVMYTQQ